MCAATEWVAADFQKRTEIECETHVPADDLSLDRERSTALFRILQESLTNIARHAQATKVEINLWTEAKRLCYPSAIMAAVSNPARLEDPRSIGLMGMRERASLLDGQCAIKPLDDGGTLVEVRLPTGSI